MFLTLRVRPHAKQESIERVSETEYCINVKEPPEQGRANARVRSLLAKALGVAAKDVIVKNPRSRVKRVEIRRCVKTESRTGTQ